MESTSIRTFYKMSKGDQQSFIIDWLNAHQEYAFNIRCLAVKKPQRHCFIECSDIQTNNQIPINFEIEIAKIDPYTHNYEISFNCSDKNPLFKRFATFKASGLHQDMDDVLSEAFEHCLWGGRHEYVANDPVWQALHK